MWHIIIISKKLEIFVNHMWHSYNSWTLQKLFPSFQCWFYPVCAPFESSSRDISKHGWNFWTLSKKYLYHWSVSNSNMNQCIKTSHLLVTNSHKKSIWYKSLKNFDLIFTNLDGKNYTYRTHAMLCIFFTSFFSVVYIVEWLVS